MTPRRELGTARLFAFALPAMPLAALYSPITVYLPPFYGTEMGLGLAVVGGVFIFARVWDIVTDPVLGILSDRVAIRGSRRRPWLAVSVPLLLVTVVMVFMPRAVSGETVSAGYLMFWLAVMYVGYTLATLSQYSWASELSADYNERSRIMGWREFFHLSGMLAVLSLPAAMEYFQGNTSLGDKVATMGMYVLVLLPLTVGLAVAVVPEHPHRRNEQLDWREGMRILLRNAPMRRVLATDLAVGIPGGVMGSLYVFFVMDVIRAPEWLTVILLGFFAAGLLGVPLTVRLSYRVGKHHAIVACCVAMILVTLGFLALEPGDVLPFAALIVASGLVFNGINAMLRSITADITDYDQVHSGSERAGLYYALLTLTSKIGYAFALITYPVLEWLGYEAGGQSGAQAIDALRYTFVVFPLTALVVAICLMWRFPIGLERQREIRRLLSERQREDESVRPQDGERAHP
ncbi:MAG: MFS transporter [Gammaproteobacteria bacterium]|nr:MFS transporter [Gammaproteobacteria bacterium]MDE0366193.1 MFS transporter [Gammaproteobacteria bacterium]